MNFYDSNSGLLQNMYEKCDWECVSYQTFYQPNYGNILHLLLLVRIKDHIKLMIVGNNFEKTFLFLMFWKEFKRRPNSRNKMKLALLWDHIGLMIVRLKQFWKKLFVRDVWMRILEETEFQKKNLFSFVDHELENQFF